MFHHCEDADLSTVLLKLQAMKENLLAYLTEDLFTTSVTEEREEGEFQETYWGVIKLATPRKMFMRLYGHAHEVFRFSSPSLKKGGRSVEQKKERKAGSCC